MVEADDCQFTGNVFLVFDQHEHERLAASEAARLPSPDTMSELHRMLP